MPYITGKVRYEVPYARIHQVLLLRADRRYEATTYATAVATFGAGALLILKKHHVETVVLDYVNDRGGKMGIVIEMEPSQDKQFRDLLTRKSIPVVEPEGVPETGLNESPGTRTRETSKP